MEVYGRQCQKDWYTDDNKYNRHLDITLTSSAAPQHKDDS